MKQTISNSVQVSTGALRTRLDPGRDVEVDPATVCRWEKETFQPSSRHVIKQCKLSGKTAEGALRTAAVVFWFQSGEGSLASLLFLKKE